MLSPRMTLAPMMLPMDLIDVKCERCGRPLRTREGRKICYRCLTGIGGV